jgi:hypothetical protein
VSSPTQRSLKVLRQRGLLADVVERWIPRVNKRKDLYGFIDILAIGEGRIVGVQATSASNMASRISKIANHPNLGAVRGAGIEIWVYGWRKNSKGLWVLREVNCS